MKGINWAGVIAATIVGVVIGILWYGVLFENQWMALTGISTSEGDATTSMALGVVNQLVVAVGLSWLINKAGTASLIGGATTGGLAAVFFALTTAALGFIYAGQNTGLIPIDFGYLLISYAAMGATVGAVKLGSKSAAAA